ncbi:VOC family protein [Actinomadura chokoriensis]|uniref:VOC family protein n=1 Tax=Actinomadura chokoriensis TaxID=454156 RepID=A0ABV4QPR1_9ACTN
MPEVTSYAPGFPTWAELASPDPALSRRFYGELLGWSSYTLTTEMDEYEIFTLGGVQAPEVAGMQTLVDDSLPSYWMCYFRTADVAASVEAVRAAGGHVLVEDIEVANLGRMALCSDLESAEFAFWYPYDLQGAGARNEPGALYWMELACQEAQAARAFYGRVFGWKAEEREYYTSSTYTNWKVGDTSVASMVSMDEHWPPGYPAHWVPYFGVVDCDAAAAKAVDLGGRVTVSPKDIKRGRFAIVTDPTGARLGVFSAAATGGAATRAPL